MVSGAAGAMAVVARIVMMKDGLLPEAVLVARGEITTYGNRLFQRRELIAVGGCPRGAWGDHDVR